MKLGELIARLHTLILVFFLAPGLLFGQIIFP